MINKLPLLNWFQKTWGARDYPVTLLARIPKTMGPPKHIPLAELQTAFLTQKTQPKERGWKIMLAQNLSIRTMISISIAAIPGQETLPLPWRTTIISSLVSWFIFLFPSNPFSTQQSVRPFTDHLFVLLLQWPEHAFRINTKFLNICHKAFAHALLSGQHIFPSTPAPL